jgi:hypothetical protein
MSGVVLLLAGLMAQLHVTVTRTGGSAHSKLSAPLDMQQPICCWLSPQPDAIMAGYGAVGVSRCSSIQGTHAMA